MVMRIGARLEQSEEAGFDQNTYEIIEQYKTILDKARLAGGERDRRGLKG